MEMVVGLFGAIGSVGSAVAARASSLLPAIGTASGALSILQGVATAGSVMSTVKGGVGSYQEAQTSASLARLEGEQQLLASEEKALRIKRDAIQKAGAARVAMAASGVEIGSGTAGVVEDNIMTRAGYETSIERNNAVQRQIMAQMRADRFQKSGEMSLVGAQGQALGQVASFAGSLARRG